MTARARWRSTAPLMATALLVLLLVGRAGRPWVEFGPQQHVTSTNPKMGVHTRLTDEVEPWKVQRTFELTREMGATWVVEYFLWAAHEPQRGVYDWSHADLVVDHAVNQGLTVIRAWATCPNGRGRRMPRTCTWTRKGMLRSPHLLRPSPVTSRDGCSTSLSGTNRI